jgi:hypothetical protein
MLCYVKPFNLTLSFLPIAGFFLSLYVGGDSEIVAFRSLRDAHHHHCVPSEVLHMNSEVTDTGQEVQSHDAQSPITVELQQCLLLHATTDCTFS